MNKKQRETDGEGSHSTIVYTKCLRWHPQIKAEKEMEYSGRTLSSH